ncbi:unnamed protein product [Rhizoctonia solani]|uniref:Ketopantoate reductase N-terminal domain-containing protein n=1 Tax=Rhizoctonia solani TaxID=456999 RepID=A0A8H3CL38_9AGAM|nr:unnamed protein product [Rhizoctonia solani]
MSAPKICVVGFGALGTIYSFILEKAGAQVTAVCRSNYASMQGTTHNIINLILMQIILFTEHGIDIQSQKLGVYLGWRPHRVVDSVDSAANVEDSYDYVVCTFKCLPDIITTPQLLGPLLARSRNFVLIQNGIGIELDLQAAVPEAVVMSGCAWIDATVVDHGRTLRHGPIEKLVVGAHQPLGAPPEAPHSTEAHTALTTFVDLLKSGGGTPEQAVNIEAARWKKIIWHET